ncbi:MAG TPA: hypothetical protein VFF62_14845, partial [Candidatus Nitrosocosmicus sp.]|nr:hypothetical protein [Candidatus Nitrosocosmicus sp.]
MSEEMKCEPGAEGERGGRQDDLDRRGFLHCMAWAGTGLVWVATGGMLSSQTLGVTRAAAQTPAADFSFVQISDTHIGFRG